MIVKVGLVGDSQIGKTTLMVKYVEGSYDEDYIQTLGIEGQIFCSINSLSAATKKILYPSFEA